VTTAADDVVGRPLTADDGLVRSYRERTPGSAAAFEAARRVLPGGETRAVTSYPPYPVIITEGHGARLTDADGHVYLDLVNNYTAMVHGSAFAPATEAVAGLLPHGYAFASPHPYQVALAELLAARVPSVQRVRFTNSGTEAALLAARIVARATGRRRLLMFDGAYHGSAALFLPGFPDVVRVPWNDQDAVTALLGRADHDVAAVFAEPFLGAGGVRPAAPGFLAAVAALARDRDVLFVLDEVQGLRNGFGGEQGRLGLTPDLTLLGKIIGGGFPIGAVGCRADLLELTVASLTPGYVTHAGTFNGHLAAAVAGTMTLRHLDAAAISRLNDAAAAVADPALGRRPGGCGASWAGALRAPLGALALRPMPPGSGRSGPRVGHSSPLTVSGKAVRIESWTRESRRVASSLRARPPRAAARQLAGLQDEEQEAQEALLGREVVGEQLAGGRHGLWLADDGDPEASRGEGVGHRVQRPVPEAHQSGLATEGPFLGPVVGREIVGPAPGLTLDSVDGEGMVDGHDQPAAGLQHAPQLG
jgi:glutamate-1-semialdehyde 2,1-aminomutase